jgi:hypothetical protein
MGELVAALAAVNAANRHTKRLSADFFPHCDSAAEAAAIATGCGFDGGGGRSSGGDASAALNCLKAEPCFKRAVSARKNMTLSRLSAVMGDTVVAVLVRG